MESMARGVPVIATRSGAVTELADDRNALLCEPNDSEGVARAIVELARDPALRDRLGAAGRERIEQEFDVRACSRTLAEAIDDERGLIFVTSPGVEISA
jgi:glycosyltransferase involved in cell wall biosynthesis